MRSHITRYCTALRFSLVLIGVAWATHSLAPAAEGDGSDTVVVVRHAPDINGGRIEGSVRQLAGESVSLLGTITSDWLVPGTPNVVLIGATSYGGTLDGTGSTLPGGYTITIKAAPASVRHVVRRSDPIALPAVAAPPAPAGTRDITINGGTGGIGDPLTLRNLTLSAQAGPIALPPGTYGSITLSGASTLVIGQENAAGELVYNFQSLVLNGDSKLTVVSRVKLVIKDNVEVTGECGSAAHPEWLSIQVSSGTVTLNGTCRVFGSVSTPSNSVTLNGDSIIKGSVSCDHLTVNAGGVIRQAGVVNQPPAIAAGATATPNPVPGTQTQLSVLGSNDGGETNLKYTWQTTGAAPAPVTFDVNGTNAAKNAVATFTKAGNYEFSVTVEDASGLTAASTVSVVVSQTLTTLIVSPAGATVPLFGTQQYSAAASDQFGDAMAAPAVTWTVAGGGSIDAAGLFSSNGVAGGPFNVVATSGNVSGTATVTIVNTGPAVVASANPNPVTGTATTLSAAGTDDGGEVNLTYIWQAEGNPPAPVTFSLNNSNAAKQTVATFSTHGTYTFNVTAADAGGLSAVSTVEVQVNQAVTSIRVLPANATVSLNGTQQFNATLLDQFSAAVPAQPVFAWAVTGGGTIADTGLFTAGDVAGGPFDVTASADGRTGTASVSIVNATPSVVASADPNPVTGTTTTLSAVGTDDGGEPNLIYTWQTEGNPPAPVTFSLNNSNAAKQTLATFTTQGTYQFKVTATDAGGLSAVSTVDVQVNQTAASIRVLPANATVNLNGTQQFNATLLDQFSAAVPNQPAFAWAVAGGGTISNSGLFTAAGAAGGPFDVKATANNLVGTATVSVVNAAPTVAVAAAADPNPTPTLSTQLSVLGNDDGGEANLTYTWATAGNLPAPVSFSVNGTNASKTTSATFAQSGSYDFTVTIHDGALSVASNVTVLVNLPPQVNAGANQTIKLPSGVFLAGTATDDGFPNPPGALTISWTKLQGPGAVTFTHANQLNTAATFGMAGTYVLELSVFDGQITSRTNVTITVRPTNDGPVVSAGPDRIVALPTPIPLDGIVIDDGKPAGNNLTIQWSKSAGPGNVTFADATSPNTSASASMPGQYVLTLVANDGELAASSFVSVTVMPATNQPPRADAGVDRTAVFPQSIAVTGTASDDGLPEGAALTTLWSKADGPGTVTFNNPTGLQTDVSFSAPGSYVLKFTASDTQLASSDTLIVVVSADNTAPVVTAGAPQSIRLNESASLTGFATDDGLPAGSVVAFSWSKVDGPGNVVFADAMKAATTATFSETGAYVLRLTASDSALQSFADVLIIVSPRNAAPTVNAGDAQNVFLPYDATEAAPFELKRVIPFSFGSNEWPHDLAWHQPSNSLLALYNRSLIEFTARVNTIKSDYSVVPFSPHSYFLSQQHETYFDVAPDDGGGKSIGGFNAGDVFAYSAISQGIHKYSADGATQQLNWVDFGAGSDVCGQVYIDRTGLFGGDLFSVEYLRRIVWRVTAAGVVTQFAALPEAANCEHLITIPNDPAKYGPLAGKLVAGSSTAPRLFLIDTNGAVSQIDLEGGISTVEQVIPIPSNRNMFVPQQAGDTYVVSAAALAPMAGDLLVVQRANAAGHFLGAMWRLHWNGTAFEYTQLAAPDPNRRYNHVCFAPLGDKRIAPAVPGIRLNGSVEDDGLPAPSGLSVQWSKLSGPGEVTFGDRTDSRTTAFFGVPGIYVLRLTATDGEFTSTSDVTVTATRNQRPIVDAGENTSVRLPQQVNLQALVTDDGLPGPLTTGWSVVSVPPGLPIVQVQFSSTGPQTTASFSRSGTYVLRYEADDGALIGSDDITITVLSNNLPPSITGGASNLGVAVNSTLWLEANVTDDGLPNNTLTSTWVKEFGPGDVVFEDPNAATTRAWFSAPGTYILRLTASDSDLSTSGVKFVGVFTPLNTAPVCSVAPVPRLTWPNNVATLTGTATDDGLPLGSQLAVSWAYNGPGTAVFSNPTSLTTNVTFSTPSASARLIRLAVSDGEFTTHFFIEMFVSENSPPVVNAGLPQNVVLPAEAVLQGTVTDDGLPNPPGAVTVAWTFISGPPGSTPTIHSPNTVNTNVSFPAPGTYHFRLTANDSAATAFSDVAINVLPQGTQPLEANAGPDQIITSTLPASTTLLGSGTSEAEVFGVDAFWTKISGPGTVIFSAHVFQPTVSFSRPGVYVLQLRVSNRFDGSAAVDQVTITVNGINSAPVVNAGPFKNIVPPGNSVQLDGSFTDDLLPEAVIPTVAWTLTNGPGEVAFTHPNSVVTNATFSTSGVYTLRLTVNDSEFVSFDETIVTFNAAPTVSAGPDQTIVRPAAAFLNGTANDDGLPIGGALSVSWTKTSLGGEVSFENANALSTRVTFNLPGTYVFRLSVNDGQLSAADEVTVLVKGNAAPVVSAGPDVSTTLPLPATLNGSVTDDALPAPVSMLWGVVNGPGGVTFANPNAAATTASFGAPGVYILRLTATDTQLTVFDDVSVTVAAPANQAPVVNAGDDQTVTMPGGATLTGTATDDGLPVGILNWHWEKFSGPGLVTITLAGGNVVVNFTAPGEYVIRASASDTLLSSSDDVAITVLAQNTAPVVSAGSALTVPINLAAQLNGSATDDGLPNPPGGLAYSWTKVSGPGNVLFDNALSPVTEATFSATGDYVLRLSASDGELSAFAQMSVIVTAPAANRPPLVSAGADVSIRLPADTAPLSGSVSDDGLPNPPGVTTKAWTKLSGPGTVTFANPASSSTSATFGAAGKYVLRLTASDGEFTSFDDVNVRVFTEVNGDPPLVKIHAPVEKEELGETDEVTKPTAVMATSTTSDWTLEYGLLENEDAEPAWVKLAEGSAALANARAADFDPTLLLNGVYSLRLTGINESGQIATDTVKVVVARNMKIGNFTLAFNDCSVPVAGIPITVSRIYDSRDKRQGDFGVGWRLGMSDVRLQKSRNLGRGWDHVGDFTGFIQKYNIKAIKSHTITVTFPDGKVYKFEGRVNPSQQSIAPITSGNFTYVAVAPTVGTLRSVGNSSVFVQGVPDEQTPTVSATIHNSNGTLYNPTVFELTTAEGMKLIIEQGKGLRSLTDLNGNTLTVTPDGYIHSSGKSVVFTRDNQGRITKITDPSGNAMEYTYDGSGNLSTFTDRSSNTTSFTYNNVHGLLTITDPRGITPIRNDYDDNGRLVKHTDAFGKEIVYTHNIDGRAEMIRDRLNNTTTYIYDDNGNVLQLVDQEGGVTNYTYDARDNEKTVTKLGANGEILSQMTYEYDTEDNRTAEINHLNERTEYVYGPNRRLLTTKDPLLRVTENAYDHKHNMTTVKDALNQTTTIAYDYNLSPYGGPLSMTDALLNVTQYGYDNAGNQALVRDAFNHDTTMAYDAANNVASQTTTRTVAGNVETLVMATEYDSQNRPTKTTFADNTYTTMEYNAIGRLSIMRDQLGRETKFEYDEFGQLKKTIYPDMKFEEIAYDDEGREMSRKDRAGRVTMFEYDKAGRLTKTIYPDGKCTRTVYDKAGQIVESYDERNNITKFRYDTAGQRIEVEDALGKITKYTYDKNGNVKTMTDANQHTTTYEYDELNRRTKTISHDGTFTKTDYDELSRRIAETDQDNKTTLFRYDKLGRLVEVEDALHQITKYGYNEVSQQIIQTDARLKTTAYEFDKLGRRTRRTLPMSMFETYTYDSIGNLRTRTDFNGRTTTYDYDSLNRLEKKTPDPITNEPIVRFTYTATGQRETMEDAHGITSYMYDNRDRLLTKQSPNGTLTYTYDDAGNIVTLRSLNPNGVSMDYSYDALNRLSTATDNRRTHVTTYNYDDVGNLKECTYPNGVKHAWTYNTLNRLTNVTASKAAASLSSYNYDLSPAGNRRSVTELSGRKATYTYDAIYRLKDETIQSDPNGINGLISYTYDAVGNRLSRNSSVLNVPNASNTFDDNDRLNTDGYDSNGSTVNSDGRIYTYDFENRIRTVNGGAISIVYDSDGNRVSKTVNGVTTKYLVDTNNLTGYSQVVEELDSVGTVARVYGYGLDLISQDQPIADEWTQHFYGYDGQGSVRFLMNEAGTITDTYDYDAFGILVSQSGGTPNSYLYCGEQFDSDLGFYYLRARYMNSGMGRFWTADNFEGHQYDPLSLHKYLYCHNNAVNCIDPTGQWSLKQAVAVGNMVMAFAATFGQTAMRLGGQLKGDFFNAIGRWSQSIAASVIANFRGITAWTENISFRGAGRRTLDFFVQGYAKVRNGIQSVSALIEGKYRVPEAGSDALIRLQKQVETALLYGDRNAQIVVWTLKRMTNAEVMLLQETFGRYAHRIQLVDGVEGLYRWLRFFFYKG